MTFLVVVGFLIGLALFLAYLAGYTLGKRRRRSEENTGEAAVRRLLSVVFAGKDFHLMNSVTLPIGGGTTQIDHILISRFGVFVIEEAIYQYLELNEWQIQSIQRGMKDIEEGRSIPHETLVTKWEAKIEGRLV